MKNREKILITFLVAAFILAIITAFYTIEVSAEEYLQAYANVDTTLNIREEQKEDSKIVGSLTSGEIVTMLAQNEEWAFIETPYVQGYVKIEYLKTFTEDEIVYNSIKIPPLTPKNYELLSTTVISNSKSSKSRNFNMSKACDLITGTELEPGEVFAWFDVDKYFKGVGAVMLEGVVGPASKENGFKEAPVIINHKSAKGYGGGVCQVSTALFNAINKIGIVPLERHRHTIPSSYCEKGMDATVNYSQEQAKRSNFIFQNTKDFPIRIETYSKGGSVYVDLYKVIRG